MKYQLSSAKRPAAPAKKPFDFVAAQEALSESLDRMSSAYAEFVAAEGRVTEVEEVINNCRQAVVSIEKYGLTPQGMALFNGDSGRDLDEALGLENLSIESLTTMSAATKDALKKQYLTGLEGKAAELWKTLVERVKAFFAKLINWLKEVVTGSAKLVKMVQETPFDKELDGDKKVTVLKYSDAEALLKAMQDALKNVQDINKTATQLVGEGKSFDLPKFEKAEGTVKELGWDAGKAKTLKGEFMKLGASNSMDAAWKAIQAEYKKEIAQNGEDPGMVKRLQDKLNNWKLASKITGQYNAALRLVGFTLLTLAKAEKAAAAPKE